MTRGRAWCIDDEGYIHIPHPVKRGLTRCRRPTRTMTKSWDGSLFCDCEACRDLIKMEVAGEKLP